MEKFFALLLTAAVLLGLSACSDQPDTQAEQFPPTTHIEAVCLLTIEK